MNKLTIKKIKIYILSIKPNIKVWAKFIIGMRSLLNKDDLILFHTEPWQTGWDLEERSRVYAHLLGRKKVIFINLKNRLQVYIACRMLLGKQYQHSELVESDILCRGLWDEKIGGDFENLSVLASKKTYMQKYQRHVQIEKNKKLYFDVQELIQSNRIKSLVLLQEAYYEMWLGSLAHKFSKKITYPETELGFINVDILSISKKKQLYQAIFDKLGKYQIAEAKNSLQNRIIGNYEKSTLGKYPYGEKLDSSLNLKHEVDDYSSVIVFFFHAFTDSPNYGVTNINEFNYIDHFSFFMEFIEGLEKYQDILLLLRFHPHKDNYLGDAKYESRVRSYVSNLSNIEIIPSSIPIKILGEAIGSKFKAITGFGSVIQECAFLELPIYSYKKNIYTEMGISKYIEDLGSFYQDEPFSAVGFSDMATKIEAARIYASKKNIFDINNYEMNSCNRLIESLDFERS